MTFAGLGLALVKAVSVAAFQTYQVCKWEEPHSEHIEIQNIGNEADYLASLDIWGD